MNGEPQLWQCAQCLCLASRSAARSITALYDGHLRVHGIRITQFSILAMLILRGETPVGVLAEALGMDRTTLTLNSALLEGKGWLEYKANAADARSSLLAVSRCGKTKVEEAFPAWQAAQQAATQAIGDHAVQVLRQLSHNPFPD
jgi:DNA-binding MarR family transcriptional regulator